MAISDELPGLGSFDGNGSATGPPGPTDPTRTLPTEGGGRAPSSDVPPAVRIHDKTVTAATSNYRLAGVAILVESGSE